MLRCHLPSQRTACMRASFPFNFFRVGATAIYSIHNDTEGPPRPSPRFFSPDIATGDGVTNRIPRSALSVRMKVVLGRSLAIQRAIDTYLRHLDQLPYCTRKPHHIGLAPANQGRDPYLFSWSLARVSSSPQYIQCNR